MVDVGTAGSCVANYRDAVDMKREVEDKLANLPLDVGKEVVQDLNNSLAEAESVIERFHA